MFSRIGDLLTVNSASPDGGRKDRQQDAPHDRKPAPPSNVPQETQDDAVILSTAALRAMIAAENPPDAQAALARIERLESHGLFSLPLAPGRTATDAVRDAAAFLSQAW